MTQTAINKRQASVLLVASSQCITYTASAPATQPAMIAKQSKLMKKGLRVER